MLKKEDWQNARTQWESLLVNALINIEAYKAGIAICEAKIKEFPDEDPMPEEAKTIIEEAKK